MARSIINAEFAVNIFELGSMTDACHELDASIEKKVPLRFISAQDVLVSLLPQGFEIKDWGGSGRGS